MSKLIKNGYGTCLTKEINGTKVYLLKSFDLTHGFGWFCHVHKIENAYLSTKATVGWGFHKKNRFSAVRQALKEVN